MSIVGIWYARLDAGSDGIQLSMCYAGSGLGGQRMRTNVCDKSLSMPDNQKQKEREIVRLPKKEFRTQVVSSRFPYIRGVRSTTEVRLGRPPSGNPSPFLLEMIDKPPQPLQRFASEI